MYKNAGHFMTTRGKRQRENRPTLFAAVGATIFDMEVAPYCTPGDLASFASTCRDALPCVMALTELKIWPVSILLKQYKTRWTWTQFPERMSHVQSVHMDKSITSLPVAMGLTSCREVYFFPPLRTWHSGLRPRIVNVHPAMYLTGVVTLRFDEGLTPCYFGRDFDLKFPSSVQTIVCGRSPYDYGEGSLQPEWFMRALPSSVTTCVLTWRPEMHVDLEDGVLPKALRSLTLEGGGSSGVIRDGVLPLALETLILAGNWTLRPTNVLSRCKAIVKLVLNHSARGGYVAMDHSMYPPNLETLVLGPKSTQLNDPLKIPGSVKKLVFHLKYTNQLAIGALPEGLTHLELVDVGFVSVNIRMFVFPQTLKYVKFSRYFLGLEDATFSVDLAVDFLNSNRPDIVVEVGGVTEYKDVFNVVV